MLFGLLLFVILGAQFYYLQYAVTEGVLKAIFLSTCQLFSTQVYFERILLLSKCTCSL